MITNEQLHNIFQNKYDASTWQTILKEVFCAKEVRIKPEKLNEVSTETETVYFLGKQGDDHYEIGYFYYKLNAGSVVHKRVGLRNLTKTFTNPMFGRFDAVIAVFDDGTNWRVSFISDINGDKTNPKRYTFVFGTAGQTYKTAISRFSDLQNKGVSYESLKAAFSVEALSDEFFKDYKQQYEKFCNFLYEKKTDTAFFGKEFVSYDEKTVRDYVKKMLGRIVFLYFLQKKGWLGVPEKNIDFAGGNLNFMQTLYNKASKEQRNNFLDKVLEPLFFGCLNEKRTGDIFDTKVEGIGKVKIPYLNGGLFEKDEIDKPDSKFPADYFADLFELFSQYNFTIDENDPNDAEVGVDPEMLGKIFENLLEDNKDKGTFYTPKEIVQYMCRESLIAYLAEKCDARSEDIRTFVQTHQLPKNTEQMPKSAIYEALCNVKICDPAIGSGAFPMCLLNELFACRMALVKNLQETPVSVVDIKREIIQNNIYGVDIEKGAVDIARLRFWLALVVDETVPQPLPNLDYKIMQGNSLLESYQGKDLSGLVSEEKDIFEASFACNVLRRELKKDIKAFFSCNEHKRKPEIRKKINENVISQLKKMAYKPAKNFCADASSEFFLWHTWFSEVFDEGGFDIVIGNPPYISTKGVTTEDKQKYEAIFGFSDDTYNLFTFKGMELLTKNGSLTYITPKTFWTTQTKRNMRDLILSKTIRNIFDTANPFDSAMVDTCITQVINKPFDEKNEITFLDGSKDLINPLKLASVKQSVYINTQNSVIFKPTEQNLKIWNLYGKKVKDLYNQWWNKISTSKKIAQNAEELKVYRESLKPGDIALLGCLTEGGQGLATANNGKYIAVRKSTKWAKNILESRPKKLAEAVRKHKIMPSELDNLTAQDFLATRSEKEIAKKFDALKEKYGRDIFGQGYIFRLIDDSEMADVETLTDDEKENGIATSKNYYVPYDKGDKDGNRWYLETPFAIAWSRENVRFLKTDPKARYQGYTFFFKEGFCWTDVSDERIRCRIKYKTVNDVLSMALYTQTHLPDFYLVCLVNSTLIGCYIKTFINTTCHFQINDARQVPIIDPNERQLDKFKNIFESAVFIKEQQFSSAISIEVADEKLAAIQTQLDNLVNELYAI